MMDSMQPYLQSNHRKYFHDMQTVVDVYSTTGNPMAALSAYLHIWLDFISDEVGQDRAVARCYGMIMRGEIKL